jgi:hypothetical protein
VHAARELARRYPGGAPRELRGVLERHPRLAALAEAPDPRLAYGPAAVRRAARELWAAA